MRRLRGFGDTTFAFQGGGDGGGAAAPLPEVAFSLEVQGERERPWRVQRFEHHEALSRVYACVIDVASERFADNPDLLLGRAVTLTVQRAALTRRVHGVVSRVEQRGTTGSDRLARITVVPALWTLSQRSDARVFQDMTAVEVALAVLRGAGLYASRVTVTLARALPRREYCVQYRETDLAFFERLLASEGVTYLFTHDGDGAESLRLTDAFHDAPAVPTLDQGPVPVAGPEGVTAATETVRNLTWVRALRPTQVTVRDYDFTRPHLPLEAAAPRGGTEHRALFEPAPEVTLQGLDGARYTDDDARERAAVRLDAEAARAALGGGEGVVSGMTPGMRFALTLAGGHVPNQHFLLTEVTHHGDAQEELLLASEREALADQRYRNTFGCVLHDTPLRPPPVARPAVTALQTATVTGPAGEEVYTDAHGRVKVRFHWDRHGAPDERASCWVRAMQGPWAGGGWGFQFVPRVGMEVAVSFLDGDPDRPVIVGALFNGQNVPPWELPTLRTCSGMRSQSVGGVGFHELSFDDTAGAERLYLHAQRDFATEVRRDHAVDVGGEQRTRVRGDLHVEGARHGDARFAGEAALTASVVSVTTAHDQRAHAGGDHHTRVEGHHTLAVDGASHVSVDGNLSQQVGGHLTAFVGEDRDVTVQGDDTASVWGDQNRAVQGALRLTVQGAQTVRGDGDITVEGRGAVEVVARASITLRCGASVIELTPDEVRIRAPKVRVEGAERVSLDGRRATLDLHGGEAELFAASRLEAGAPTVRVVARDADLTLDADGVHGRARRAVDLAGGGATLTLDGDAALKGQRVKLARGAGGGAFKGRIGLPDNTESVHVLATQLFSPGGMPLAHELVQVIDPQTDEAVTAPVRTNERGELHVEVPHPGPWDLRLCHDAPDERDLPDDRDLECPLHVRFVDPRGEAVVDLPVRVTGAVTVEARTDEDGVLLLHVPPGAYALEVPQGDDLEPLVFHAHTAARDAREAEGRGHFVFVYAPEEPDEDDALREHRMTTRDVDLEQESE